ncbi:bifunctional diguanylate cyclase/phosphodiesterase [Salmonella enterica subsp. enterica serovar Virchow]|nr:bifunctional diguanylate cyclase/phosphodiesterase [Salmonella enterica subsp. enterica serovar Virchow]
MPNRIALANELNALLGARENEIAVAFVDLDGFKEVNDNYDHNVGDRLIQTVSRGLAILVDGKAGTYRLGGDEFILVFSDRDAHGSAQSFAMNLIQFLAKPFDFEGRLASVGASIGIATSNGEMMDAAELMRRADIAMYRAKHEGKSRHCTYLPEFDAERVEDIAIAERLSAVLGAEGLDVVYQPIFDTRTRDMVGVEALCRWPEGHGGKVDTERFVRVAENSGLIDALGVSVLARACSQASRWSGIRLAVNISVAQLRNPNFAESALRIIDESGMSRDRIELEVTETRLVEDARRANAVFRLLRLEGVQIALDDFGAGYSSIGYLRQFEFDRIKIDRSLVSRVLDGSTDHNLVQGTMLLASGLSASVTAEGVESEQQISALRAIGCTEMQGFYLSRPVSADEIDILLARHDRIVA